MKRLSRRQLVFGTAVAASCRRRRAEGFPGYAFVANSAGSAVAVVDLGAFATVRHIRLEGNPNRVFSHPTRPVVYALTPDTGCIHEIDATSLSLGRSTSCAGRAFAMRHSVQQDVLWLLTGEGRRLIRVETRGFVADGEIELPNDPADFDLSPDGKVAAVGHGSSGRVSIVDLNAGSVKRSSRIKGSADLVRFRSDGRHILVANQARRTLSILDAASSGEITHLPLSVRPEHLCFKPDGGQLFITGSGLDAVTTVHPYETQVASTTLAGGSPGPMAATEEPDYLFVANQEPGDVTVIDIDTQRVAAVVSVGQRPGFITTTPDSQYALVLNRESGDMAVIRIESLTNRRRKFAPLFTMVPVGSRPVHAVIRAV